MKLFSNNNTDVLNAKAAETINELLTKYRNKSILFLVSGGSAFNLLEKIDYALLGNHITLSVLDERYSNDEKINNFIQLKETHFYTICLEKNVGVIDTSKNTEYSLEEAAEKFEENLRQWKMNFPEGVVIATQGIGEDGHTSGVMPFPENLDVFNTLFESNQWVVGYDAKEKNKYPLRITTTITFLKNIINETIVYAVGESKKKALEQLFKEGSLAEIPARVIKEMKSVHLFTSEPIQ